jgi:FkbM family methyltransferase
MKNTLLSALETHAPSIPNRLRYMRHVQMRSDFVYQSVTLPIFGRMNSTQRVGVDVGANLGIFTRFLMKHFDHVIAVEPLPDLAAKIERIFGTTVQVENCALGSTTGSIIIRTPVDAQGNAMHALTTAFEGNDLKMFEHQSVLENTVRVAQLDALNQSGKQIAFIKIDVEGFELEVLKGAGHVLSEDRPVVMIEISKGHNPQYADTLEHLAKAGYRPFVLRSDGLAGSVVEAIESQPLSLSDIDPSAPAPFFDFLFVPEEFCPTIADLIIE